MAVWYRNRTSEVIDVMCMKGADDTDERTDEWRLNVNFNIFEKRIFRFFLF